MDPCFLMRLPLEQRHDIYSYLLDDTYVNCNQRGLAYTTALFTVNKQTFAETLRFFYNTNVFVSVHGSKPFNLFGNCLRTKRFTCVLRTRRSTGICTSLALHVRHNFMTDSSESDIFAARALPEYINCLNWLSWCK